MSARTYNPFAVEKPVLELGPHGRFTLGELTDSRQEALSALFDEFEQLGEREDAKIADVAAVVGKLLEAACIGGAGLAEKLVALCDESVHREDALGAQSLNGVVRFVAEWFSSEASAGEG